MQVKLPKFLNFPAFVFIKQFFNQYTDRSASRTKENRAFPIPTPPSLLEVTKIVEAKNTKARPFSRLNIKISLHQLIQFLCVTLQEPQNIINAANWLSLACSKVT